MTFLNMVNAFVTKHMSFFVVLIAGIALFVPHLFLWVTAHVSLLLGIVMFGMGTTLKLADFKLIFQRPRDVLLGVCAQFLIMPLLAYCIVECFPLPTALAVGVLLVGSCPGGTASNVITYLARGDVALSVSMTMVSTLLSPIVTPFLILLLAGERIEVSFLSMMFSICQVVLLPIALGIFVNAFFERTVRKYTPYLPLLSIIAIVLIIGGIIAVNAAKLTQVGMSAALVVILHNICGLGLGFVVAKLFRMGRERSAALSIEVGMQNSGLAASLALMYFSAEAAIAGALFSVWHNISGSLLASYFARKAS
ncbi:MAG: bile acid:sodium symporter family protein [Desulfovibrio sp.]|nr:bile acid:sodium symporter family protein [Desulfovibrio sp.]